MLLHTTLFLDPLSASPPSPQLLLHLAQLLLQLAQLVLHFAQRAVLSTVQNNPAEHPAFKLFLHVLLRLAQPDLHFSSWFSIGVCRLPGRRSSPWTSRSMCPLIWRSRLFSLLSRCLMRLFRSSANLSLLRPAASRSAFLSCRAVSSFAFLSCRAASRAAFLSCRAASRRIRSAGSGISGKPAPRSRGIAATRRLR